MNIHHYSVFAAALGGGKHVAIVEGVDNPVDMSKIAASSGAPLTGFILSSEDATAYVRFFSPTKAKGSSDSGALVVAEHLRLKRAIRDYVFVLMGEDELQVAYENEKWWSEQEDTGVVNVTIEKDTLLKALGIQDVDLETKNEVLASGGHKFNVIVTVKDSIVLDGIKPDFETLKSIQQTHGANGFVVMADSARGLPDFRFFSPAKGLFEDNAGSYTLATICGYAARNHRVDHQKGYVEIYFEAAQRFAMDKPSRLHAYYTPDNSIAKNIRVGGQVEMLEVTKWA